MVRALLQMIFLKFSPKSRQWLLFTFIEMNNDPTEIKRDRHRENDMDINASWNMQTFLNVPALKSIIPLQSIRFHIWFVQFEWDSFFKLNWTWIRKEIKWKYISSNRAIQQMQIWSKQDWQNHCIMEIRLLKLCWILYIRFDDASSSTSASASVMRWIINKMRATFTSILSGLFRLSLHLKHNIFENWRNA